MLDANNFVLVPFSEYRTIQYDQLASNVRNIANTLGLSRHQMSLFFVGRIEQSVPSQLAAWCGVLFEYVSLGVPKSPQPQRQRHDDLAFVIESSIWSTIHCGLRSSFGGQKTRQEVRTNDYLAKVILTRACRYGAELKVEWNVIFNILYSLKSFMTATPVTEQTSLVVTVREILTMIEGNLNGIVFSGLYSSLLLFRVVQKGSILR